MNEREMLELAAKAYGDEVVYSTAYKYFLRNERRWNPLADDGDALRLSVKLGIDVSYVTNPSGENVVMASQECEFSGWFEELLSTDQFEATRRAITRAAAQIGKAMP